MCYAQVNVLAYPCVAASAPRFAHGGHASHVTCARWAADGAFAVSTGGKDRAAFLWAACRRADSSVDKSAAGGHSVDNVARYAAGGAGNWAAGPGKEVGRFWRPERVAAVAPPPQVHAIAHDGGRPPAWK